MKQMRQHYDDSFFRERLSPAEYQIMRQGGTEPPFSGRYLYWDKAGIYCCRACGQKLFLSDTKFQSASGWPAFHKAIKGAVTIRPDLSHFMIRHAVICSRCASHLGHLFYNDYGHKNLRYCINSVALRFRKKN